MKQIYNYTKDKSPSTIQGCVELIKDMHTAKLAQQASAAVTLEYLKFIAGKAN